MATQAMPLTRPVEVSGYAGAPLSCVLHTFGGERGVAIVFPGSASHGNRLGGTPARPDLHYARAVLQSEGLAVFEVWWDAGSAPKDDLEAWLDAHVAAALAAASGDHEPALLVGRSLGTWALARALTTMDEQIRALPTVWFAPLLVRAPVVTTLKELRAPAFVVGGSADDEFSVAEAEALRERDVEVVVLDGANHVLEVEDPAASARLLADVLERLRRFVARTVTVT